VRVRGAESGPRLIEVGGLDRADARAGLSEDVVELADELGGPPTELEAADGSSAGGSKEKT
jgi:cytochrome c biogenesis protein